MAIETNPRQSSIEYAVIEPPIAEIMSSEWRVKKGKIKFRLTKILLQKII